MASNDNQHRIGCFLGSGNASSRTKIIDPNAFYGEEYSSNNVPVRLEDLTISVKLTTSKRGRTSILLDEENDTSVIKQQKGATINFIEGSDINGKKVLTTKYTELTTVFEEGIYNNETFGITNIDIDFNSSYTPMIKIDFIDVRGSSIFQNEGQLLDNSENKYSSFFEFPYPLFELEIKGYYGQPVKYCLHMLKFNSKFNSQTGNFEISCEFIGYTYAMLSDMLLGILKAIPYTKMGKEKFQKINDTREPDMLNLVQLKNKISLIEQSITKAALKTEEAKDINTFKPALEILNNLEAAINNFGLEFTTKESSSTSTNAITIYDFVIMDNFSFSTQQQDRFNSLDKTVKDLVAKYNELNIQGAKINEVDLATPIIINNLTEKLLEPDSTLTISEDPKLKDTAALDLFKKDLLNYLNNNYTSINPDYKFRVMDLRSRFKVVRDQKDIIELSLKNTNKALANRIKETIVDTLGFSPTARNMIEIFTTFIEIYMEIVFEVSKKAEESPVRKELFNQVFTGSKENSDYKPDDTNFYPWPLYSEKETQKDNYIEKYLGTNNILKNRVNDIPELEFINDLLQAFLTAAREQESLDLLNAGETILYFPVNILNTKLFSEYAGNPYAIKELQNIEQIKRLMIIRGMTFLAYTNNQDYLTSEEIKQMATIEANTMLSAIINPILKVSLQTLTFDSLIPTFGSVNGNDRTLLEYKVGSDNVGRYYYKYYFQYEIDKTKVLPINSDLDGYQTTTIGNPVVRNSLDYMRNTDNILFLTNYSSKINTSKSVGKNVKYYDYGIYVKMFTPAEYITTSTLVDTSVNTTNLLDLASLKENNIASAGFNSFGGAYGIQDFNNINFGEKDGPEGTPAMYIFYKNDSDDKNGLAFSRIISANNEGLKNVNDRNSRYDFDSKKASIPMPNSYMDFRTNEAGKLLHISGGNRFRGKDINTTPDSIVYPYIEQNYSSTNTNSFSLFGSKWYYLQKDAKATLQDGSKINVEKYVKALLFLNTLPFNMGNKYGDDDYDPFGKPEIRHLFDIKGGLVHAPRFWAAYVGGVLWWLSGEDPLVVDNQIVGGGSGTDDPVNWQYTCATASTFKKPAIGDYFPKRLNENKKVENSSVIRALPEQVRDEFKKVFFDFVNGTSEYVSWESIYSTLEITNKTPSEFCGFLDRMRYFKDSQTPIGQDGLLFITNNTNVYNYNPSDLSVNLINIDNYNIISTLPEKEGTAFTLLDRHAFLLEINGGSEAGQNLMRGFNEEIIIANTGYGIWETFASDEGSSENIDDNFDFDSLRRPIFVKEKIFKEYFKTYISAVTETVKGSTLTNQEENELNKVFGSKNKDEIKLMLYRHCKNIYDKWLGGITDKGKIIFQCGDRQTTDAFVAKKYKYDTPRLIDSFRFVTRSFKDIGDELFVNPTPIADMIADEPNTSAYNVISTLLTDNKFEFIALPTFINYKDDKMLESVFTPFNYDKAITTCGPTFVCVYTGQKSNSLDLKSGKYPNDGFDLRCTSDGTDPSIPSDFNEPLNDYEEPVPVFVVNYSQQNQNIFKDITLDQSEFTETEESLKIVQDISTKGFENNPSIGGQNMYNIYAVRSYSAEIEMLGNAMIQPMMYFQLNNIPMFHGAYMIIKTKHNIKPNYMSTTFTGTRIRRIETPIIDIAEAYMSLIETLQLKDAGTSNSTRINTTGNAIIGENCGEYKLKAPYVDGATGFEKSKPIRDLVAAVESNGNYNAYNNGDAGRKGPTNYVPSTMTIAEIQQKQAINGIARIFAVGKYQLIPKTLQAFITANNISTSSIYNAEIQEKAGEWLILKGAGTRQGLKAYFANGSSGSESDLQKAITDLGLEFASFPLYHMGYLNGKKGDGFYEDPIGYNSKTAAYGGSAGNLPASKFCAQDVARVLIETWKNYNPGKKPAIDYDAVVKQAGITTGAQVNNDSIYSDNSILATANDSSVAIIMGDSNVSTLNAVKPNGLQLNKIDISFNKVGETVSWLVKKLKEFGKNGKVITKTKFVFVAIGTNDAYIVSDTAKKNITELNNLIKKIYPNAKRVVVPGSYGWTSVKGGALKTKTKEDQDAYYTIFKNLGFTYQYPNASAALASDAEAHNPKKDFFIKSVQNIVSIKNS